MEFEKLKLIIAEILSVNPKDIKEDMSFFDDFGADSLEVFQIVMNVESEFDVLIDDKNSKTIDTVGDLLELITGKPVSE